MSNFLITIFCTTSAFCNTMSGGIKLTSSASGAVHISLIHRSKEKGLVEPDQFEPGLVEKEVKF